MRRSVSWLLSLSLLASACLPAAYAEEAGATVPPTSPAPNAQAPSAVAESVKPSDQEFMNAIKVLFAEESAAPEVEERKVSLKEAKQSGARKVSVSFDSPAPDGASLSVERIGDELKGETEWAADRKSATVTLASRLTKGTRELGDDLNFELEI